MITNSLPRWVVYAILGAILAGAGLCRLATLRKIQTPDGQVMYDHREGDEIVFRTLVKQVNSNFFAYTLQGTPLLRSLNQENYNHPLFMHPPLFTYTAYVLQSGFSLPLPLVPVVLSLLTIVVVFWIGNQVFDERVGLWAALLTAVCPVLWFVSQKIWIDNMLIFAMSFSFAVHWWATGRKQPAAYLLSGLIFSLALLSKLPAAALLPALVLTAWQRDRERWMMKAVVFGTPVLLLGGCWLLLSKMLNGYWLPTAVPNAVMQQTSSFVTMAVVRPWYFYLSNLALISPVYLLALTKVFSPKERNRHDAPLAVWFLCLWAALTIAGLGKGGFQTRYLAPAYPALAVLAADVISRRGFPAMMLVMILIGYGIMNGVLYGILWTPVMGDFDGSIVDLICQTIRNVTAVHSPQF